MPESAPSHPVRSQLARFQDFGEAHLTLLKALDGLAPEHRGVRPPGLPHSIWELVEHIRIAQRDLTVRRCSGPPLHPFPLALHQELPEPLTTLALAGLDQLVATGRSALNRPPAGSRPARDPRIGEGRS